MKLEIRRARHEDATKLIQAHRRSIREVCSADYRPEQIEVWSGRDFKEDRWQQTMDRDVVWVISDAENNIYGFGHLQFLKDGAAEVAGLYFVPEVIGKGFGKQLMQKILEQCRSHNIHTLELSATVTAKPFYESAGFKQIGERVAIHLGGQAIECFHMQREL